MRKDHGHLIRNVYYMLSYAFQTLEVKAYAEVATEDFPDMQNLFAAILAKGISWQIKQGLSRSYEEKREVGRCPRLHRYAGKHATLATEKTQALL